MGTNESFGRCADGSSRDLTPHGCCLGDATAPVIVLDIGGTKIAGGIAFPPSCAWDEKDVGSAAVASLEPAAVVVQKEAAVASPQEATDADAAGNAVAASSCDDDDTVPQLRFEHSRPTNPAAGGKAVLGEVIALARELADEFIREYPHWHLGGVGIASAGVVDEVHGVITSATDLIPAWAGTRLAEEVGRALDLDVCVLNDVHAHALGEARYGCARGKKSAVVLGVGTGIGGALITDGDILSGAHSIAGHLGHIHHRLGEDMECSCGRFGHIESVASGSGVGALYGRRLASLAQGQCEVEGDSPARGEDLEREFSGLDVQLAAEAGCDVALGVIRDSAYALGQVMGSLANTVDPEIFVLSGSMTKTGEMWWEPLREGYASSAMDPLATTEILKGSLGGKAPLLGAYARFISRYDVTAR